MILRSRPVRFLITRVARAYGFLDPVALLADLRGFAKPSEVAEPIELLRAGMLFHARGLVNTKAIQNNLDWVWPYWVERQFNPADASFIPRAFSFSHISEAGEFLATIRRSFPAGPDRRFPGAIPAAPHRRMDSGAVGSLVADYPLQLFAPDDPWIAKTADYLCAHHLHHGGFFQNMIHSGINAYLTLHLAQVRLRAGRAAAAWALMDRVVAFASPTGQWPEAIHPLTGGGCMGDGQHIWAASEWLMFVRHLFVREEGDTLVIGAGVRPEWWRSSGPQGEMSFGPTLTPRGMVTVRFAARPGGLRVQLDGAWRGTGAPRRELRVPGCAPLSAAAGDGTPEYFLPLQP